MEAAELSIFVMPANISFKLYLELIRENKWCMIFRTPLYMCEIREFFDGGSFRCF